MSKGMSILNMALAYLAAGLCVLPARRAEKRPAVGRWKQYQNRLPTPEELSAWWVDSGHTPDALCIVCGKASHHAELIDFDARGELFSAWSVRIPLDLHKRLVIERTPSGGYHAIYRSQIGVCGNLKLAQRRQQDGKIVTLIETRGEGGLFLCAPTPGYELVQGDLCDLPVLTEAERDILLQTAWELNEYVPPAIDYPRSVTPVGQRTAISAPPSAQVADIADSGADATHNPVMGSTSTSWSPQCGYAIDNAAGEPTGPSSAAHADSVAENSHIGNCPPHNSGGASHNADRPGDDFNIRGDPRKVLTQHGWVRVKGGDNEYWRRPGKTSGWSATLRNGIFYVFSANAAPFEPNRAYSPFAVYTLLEHGGAWAQAASSLRLSGYGGTSGDSLADNAHGVDISAIVRLSAESGACAADISRGGQTTALCGEHVAGVPENAIPGVLVIPGELGDPGPIPERLFHVPGLVEQVMAFTLNNAPYPNVGLAFCGAMALQSYLCGRKVCDSGDLRPNLYLLALASSGTGKDFPRKVNSRVLFEIGHVDALGDKFASGEGIQDALARTSAMLFQNDEMDGVLRQINLDRENKRESIPNILLTLYTSANDVYPMRVKAGQKDACHIDQPHLTLFGTATPQYFYESLSQRMLTNGFFARLIIVDIGKRGEGQAPGSVRNLPEPVIQVARWWAEFQPGTRRTNLIEVHPEPRVVPCTAEADDAIATLQRQTENEYDQAHARNDEVARVAWSRTHENAKKLALIYACSQNHENPIITLPGVEWASAFAMHQTRRQLFLAASYVAENPFHAECLKLMRKLQEAPDHQLSHQLLLKRMKMKTKDFKELVETLVQRSDLDAIPVQTGGRTGLVYRLSTGVKEGEGR